MFILYIKTCSYVVPESDEEISDTEEQLKEEQKIKFQQKHRLYKNVFYFINFFWKLQLI